MATVQTVFDRMEVLDQELQLQSGEADVTRGLAAVNMAQDHFEAMVAQFPSLLGDQAATVTTSANTETTTFPAGLLRLDSLWFIDPTDSLPRWRVEPVFGSGAHREHYINPVWNRTASSSVTGRPREYWTDGTNFYWNPIPDGTHTVRWYGFKAATDYTAAADTFAYPDICLTPFAAFATRLFQLGIDDSDAQYNRLAQETFGPVIKTLQNFRREGPRPIKTAGYGGLYG